MAITISHTMSNSQYENKEALKQVAKNILSKQSASEKVVDSIINKSLFNNQFEQNSQVKLLNTQAFIVMNSSLKESLRYIKNNSAKKEKKTYVLGELKVLLDENSKKEYTGELLNIEIDSSIKNIFAA